MARLGRYFLPQQPLHVIHRGNNRQAIFLTGGDAKVFATYLQEAAEAEGLAITPTSS
jgi:putative transposase